VRQLNKRRDATGEDAFAEQRALVLERRYDGRDKSTKTLRETTKDLSDRHWVERPETEILRAQGWTDDQILQLGKNEDWLVNQVGYTPQQAAEYARRGEVPPFKIRPTRSDGRPVRELADDEPVTLDNAFQTRHELKTSVKNFRQAAAEAQQRLLAQLSAQDQATGQPVADHQPEAATPPQPQATTTHQDPAAVERARIAAERAQYNEARRFSTVEVQAASQIEALNALAQQNCPELFNRDALAEVARTNPARLEELKQAHAYLERETKGAQARLQQARAGRQAAEAQITAQQQAQVRAQWHAYKDAEDSKFHQFTPEMSDPGKASAMRQGVQAMLTNDYGFGKGELARAWDGREGISIRDHRAQRIIADAYRWRQAQANAKNIAAKKAPVPPVQKPGTYRSSGSGDLENVRHLERELGEATGARAIKLATALHRARREAGI
jgi:hypothetical protein